MKKLYALVFILTFIAFSIKGILFLDPDFGWHIRMGEVITKTGIPKTDPFSYTMSSYPFVDHEWLTNIVLAKLYQFVGTKGLAFIFAILAALAIFIQTPFPIKKWSFVPFVLVAGSLSSFVGVRTQVITWVFFSILLFLMLHKKTQKRRFLLSLLFILWANVHGGFGIGVVTLFVVTLVHIWEQRRILFGEIIILILCFAATFINPYGIRLWWELWMQISDTSLRWSIEEWKPAVFVPSFALWIFIAFSAIIVTRYWKKFYLSQAVLYYGLLIAGLSSIRHMPLFLLIALSMTTKGIEWFSQEAKRYKGGTERLRKVYSIFAIGVAFVAIVEVLLVIQEIKSSYSSYPKQAVEFLAKSKSCGQLFSTYEWEGYLIWKLPEKKVFIDGRMPSWRWGSAPASESNYAFEEYNKLLEGKISAKKLIAKYKIDTVLFPVEKKEDKSPILKKLKEIETKIFEKGIDEGKFVKQLMDTGMVEIYNDNTAVIYRQKGHSTQCANSI